MNLVASLMPLSMEHERERTYNWVNEKETVREKQKYFYLLFCQGQ